MDVSIAIDNSRYVFDEISVAAEFLSRLADAQSNGKPMTKATRESVIEEMGVLPGPQQYFPSVSPEVLLIQSVAKELSEVGK